MSSGARNWPFLMLTGLPAHATAWMKSVCRQRNAGVCSTSTTAAASAISSSVCTSVSTGTPIWRFTSASTRKPSAIPGPRYEAPELRFALSYDDLKMKGIRRATQTSFSCPATSICSCSDSTTHGPAMRKSGASRAASKPHSFIQRAASDRRDQLGDGVRGAVSLPLKLVRERGTDEADEERMAAPRIRREFRVELAAEEPRVLRQLDHFAQIAGRCALRASADGKPGRLEARQVMIVDLVAMPVALGHRGSAVDLVRERTRPDIAGLRAEPHRAAQVGAFGALLDRAVAVLPLGDQRDDRMRRRRLEFGAVRVGETGLVPRILDHRELHAEADAEVRNIVLAGVADRLDLAFDAALAEAARDEDRKS